MNIDALTPEQRENVLRFLLARMDMDTRLELMSEHPVAYVRMHPAAVKSVIGQVRQAMHDATHTEGN